jgi:hypothetical protein
MRKVKLILSSALLALLVALGASAQTTRVYVANSGNDANLCTASAPCRTITQALNVVDPNGEVIITESGDYDKFSMLKPATVAAAPGVNAGIASDGVYGALNVLTSTDTVRLRNLHLKKVGDPTNSIGINNHAGTVFIDGCTIEGFETGILTTNGAGAVFIHNTTVRNNLFGISLIGPQSEGQLRVTIEGSRLEYNDTGVALGARVTAEIRDTVIANNNSRGVSVRSTSSVGRAEALIDNCLISHNTNGVVAGGANGIAWVRLTRTTISHNFLSGVLIGSNGTVYTLQNNTIVGNTPDVNGGFLTPLSVK